MDFWEGIGQFVRKKARLRGTPGEKAPALFKDSDYLTPPADVLTDPPCVPRPLTEYMRILEDV